MRMPFFRKSPEFTPPQKKPELVPGFKADDETDVHYLFDISHMKSDQEIENRLRYKTDDGRTLEKYLEPYIDAVASGEADKWFKAVYPTQSEELFRMNAAKVIAQYLVRKRNREGGILN